MCRLRLCLRLKISKYGKYLFCEAKLPVLLSSDVDILEP
jgi:hypothetical protein